MKTTVIGCGRWGSFIAWYLNRIGHDVTLYGRTESKNMQRFLDSRSNEYLTMPESVALSTELSCVTDSEIVVISIGSQSLNALCAKLAEMGVSDKTFVLCMKGIEVETGRRLSQIATEHLGGKNDIAVWIGPGHVQEFVKGVPNCMVIDSENEEVKSRLVSEFSGELIRFYYGTDLIGNEIGAASKNVIGIAAGMLDGLGLSTLKGALMSRGTREISILIEALGGNGLSAYGLCHLGDYEATVFSEHSHNRRFGELWIKGEAYDKLAEGYFTVKPLVKMAEEKGLELPICKAVHSMLYSENCDPLTELNALFTRKLKNEF